MTRNMRDFFRQASANAVGSVAALLAVGLVSGLIRPHWAEVILALSAFPVVILAFQCARWSWRRLTAHLYPIERRDVVGRLLFLSILLTVTVPAFIAAWFANPRPPLLFLPPAGWMASLILLRRGTSMYAVRTPDGIRLPFGPYSKEHERQLQEAWKARQKAER